MAATFGDAVVERITAALPDVPVYVGYAPAAPAGQRHVVLYVDEGTLTRLALCGTSDTARVHVQTTCAAWDQPDVVDPESRSQGAAMAAWLATHVRDALTDWAPTVDGWQCYAITHDLAQLPRLDPEVLERPTFYAIDQFHIEASRIGAP